MKQKNRIGPDRYADEKWVKNWYNYNKYGNYHWVKTLRKYNYTWHQIRSLINGAGYK